MKVALVRLALFGNASQSRVYVAVRIAHIAEPQSVPVLEIAVELEVDVLLPRVRHERTVVLVITHAVVVDVPTDLHGVLRRILLHVEARGAENDVEPPDDGADHDDQRQSVQQRIEQSPRLDVAPTVPEHAVTQTLPACFPFLFLCFARELHQDSLEHLPTPSLPLPRLAEQI